MVDLVPQPLVLPAPRQGGQGEPEPVTAQADGPGVQPLLQCGGMVAADVHDHLLDFGEVGVRQRVEELGAVYLERPLEV